VNSAAFWRTAAKDKLWKTWTPSSKKDEPDVEVVEHTSLGPVHVLVNVAGYVQRGALPRLQDDAVAEMINANLMSTIWSCKYLLPNLLRGKRELLARPESEKVGLQSPCIINISSVLGTHYGAGAAVYAAAKGGVISLGRALSEEYGRMGVRVNTVVPGFVDTDMVHDGVGKFYSFPIYCAAWVVFMGSRIMKEEISMLHYIHKLQNYAASGHDTSTNAL
jgi:NAD(P)-dependent dehydrogenase (short-subunit alcohol dehydrogenase family)